MKEKYGFVYLWYDKKHKRYYIGAHFGCEDDGYICSSSWMKLGYKKRPNDFRRRILKRNFITKKEMFEEEQRYLDMIKDNEFGKRYYNLQKRWTHWSSDKNKSLSVRKKMSIGVRKHYEQNGSSWQGKRHTEETKRKMSDSAKTRKTSSRKGMKWSEEAKNRNRGKIKGPLSEETKRKIGLANSINSRGNKNMLGKKHSEETKRKIGLANKNKKDYNGINF